MAAKVLTGLDRLVRDKFSSLAGKKIAILAHAASVDQQFRHIVDLIAAERSIQLVRILAPEHGLRGAAQDMAHVPTGNDKLIGAEVVSLYGGTYESLFPKKEHFDDVEVLVVDLPDVGSRYYTYSQTMAFCMKVAGECGVKVLVLDRPNPINGIDFEGAPLQKGCRSFCGYTPILNRHGLTMGEMALVYQKGFGEGNDRLEPISCDLQVLTCDGLTRSMYLDDTDVPWVLPSPNMPTLDAAIFYPGGCLIEATNISEARGTTKPFEFVGAPYLHGGKWAEETMKQGLELRGAVLRPISFLPQFQKWAKEECSGVQLHITDRKTFKPFRWGLALIAAASRVSGFKWRSEPYEFVDSVPAIDLLYGNPLFRTLVEAGKTLQEVESEIVRAEADYRSKIGFAFLYK